MFAFTLLSQELWDLWKEEVLAQSRECWQGEAAESASEPNLGDLSVEQYSVASTDNVTEVKKPNRMLTGEAKKKTSESDCATGRTRVQGNAFVRVDEGPKAKHHVQYPKCKQQN